MVDFIVHNFVWSWHSLMIETGESTKRVSDPQVTLLKPEEIGRLVGLVDRLLEDCKKMQMDKTVNRFERFKLELGFQNNNRLNFHGVSLELHGIRASLVKELRERR